LNPDDLESIPEGLLNGVSDTLPVSSLLPMFAPGDGSHAARLRAQMQADALLPLSSGLDDGEEDDASTIEAPATTEEFPPEVIEEAIYFLRLGVSGD
jgi:hypothetical protein